MAESEEALEMRERLLTTPKSLQINLSVLQPVPLGWRMRDHYAKEDGEYIIRQSFTTKTMHVDNKVGQKNIWAYSRY